MLNKCMLKCHPQKKCIIIITYVLLLLLLLLLLQENVKVTQVSITRLS